MATSPRRTAGTDSPPSPIPAVPAATPVWTKPVLVRIPKGTPAHARARAAMARPH